jgi:hypothetical protein
MRASLFTCRTTMQELLVRRFKGPPSILELLDNGDPLQFPLFLIHRQIVHDEPFDCV